MGIYKEDVNELKLKVNELKQIYRFNGLWHFTDFSNLESIFKAGELSSRKKCQEQNIKFLDGANHEVINKAAEFVHYCTRFYYRPKTPTLYDNEGIKPITYTNEVHIPRPVYLVFSEELIYHNSTLFSNGNATNSPIDKTADFFINMDWDSIFHDTWFYPQERDYIVNKRHAELLCLRPVGLEFLDEVIFRSNTDLKQAIKYWGDIDIFSVNEHLFSDKNNLPIIDWKYNNYISDYIFKWSDNRIEIILRLKKPIQDYTIKWKMEDKDGQAKTDLLKKTLNVKFGDNENNELTDISNATKLKLVFNYKPKNGDSLKIFMNNVLCIEETVRFR